MSIVAFSEVVFEHLTSNLMSICCINTIFSQLRYNSACIASFDELLKTTKKVTEWRRKATPLHPRTQWTEDEHGHHYKADILGGTILYLCVWTDVISSKNSSWTLAEPTLHFNVNLTKQHSKTINTKEKFNSCKKELNRFNYEPSLLQELS